MNVEKDETLDNFLPQFSMVVSLPTFHPHLWMLSTWTLVKPLILSPTAFS